MTTSCDNTIFQFKQQLTGAQDDFDSVPLSPELGMGIPRGSEVDELELEGLEGQTTAHAESTGSAVGAIFENYFIRTNLVLLDCCTAKWRCYLW